MLARAIFLLSLLLTAPISLRAEENFPKEFTQLKLGMTKKEVMTILSTPEASLSPYTPPQHDSSGGPLDTVSAFVGRDLVSCWFQNGILVRHSVALVRDDDDLFSRLHKDLVSKWGGPEDRTSKAGTSTYVWLRPNGVYRLLRGQSSEISAAIFVSRHSDYEAARREEEKREKARGAKGAITAGKATAPSNTEEPIIPKDFTELRLGASWSEMAKTYPDAVPITNQKALKSHVDPSKPYGCMGTSLTNTRFLLLFFDQGKLISATLASSKSTSPGVETLLEESLKKFGEPTKAGENEKGMGLVVWNKDYGVYHLQEEENGTGTLFFTAP